MFTIQFPAASQSHITEQLNKFGLVHEISLCSYHCQTWRDQQIHWSSLQALSPLQIDILTLDSPCILEHQPLKDKISIYFFSQQLELLRSTTWIAHSGYVALDEKSPYKMRSNNQKGSPPLKIVTISVRTDDAKLLFGGILWLQTLADKKMLKGDLDWGMYKSFLAFSEMTLDTPLFYYQIQQKVWELMTAFYQALVEPSKLTKKTNVHSSDLELLHTTTEWLLSHNISDYPTIEELATRAQMSVSKFKNLFKNTFEKPVYQYFLQHKMEYAHQKLATTNITVNELSNELGYSQAIKFILAYKKIYGQTPKADTKHKLKP